MKQFLHNTFLKLIRFNKIAIVLFLLLVGVCAFHPGEIWEGATNASVVKCYPNPAVSYVNFEFPPQIDKTYTLFIYSFVGRKMAELPVNGRKLMVTLNDYYRGIYVFQLRDRTGKIVETGKFQVEQ